MANPTTTLFPARLGKHGNKNNKISLQHVIIWRLSALLQLHDNGSKNGSE